MIGSFLNIFKIPDLRRKVFITLGLCIVYRLGAKVPTPFIDPTRMQEYFETLSAGQGQSVFGVINMFSGGAFEQMTIFALGIMPYISASIIFQLLQVVWPRLEQISKEGEAGRKKINQWTRYFTVVLSLFQGFGIGVFLLRNDLAMLKDNPILFLSTTAITMSAGTCFIMWLGEKITEHGIGNGISLIIAVGIISSYPYSILSGFTLARNNSLSWLALIGVLAVMIAISALIVLMQESNRKIPVQHARRMVGRKTTQGGNTFLPLKLNTAGVIPVIFSSALLSFPQFIMNMLPLSWGMAMGDWFDPGSSKLKHHITAQCDAATDRHPLAQLE